MGALLAVLVTHSQLDIIALIGIILLIGIVKKNAILMIDFAIQAERNEGNSPRTVDLPGLLVALPAHHDDHYGRAFWRHSHRREHRQWRGIAPPVGHCHCAEGSIVSQMLTLYTTPVVYLYMDRLRPGRAAERGYSGWTPYPLSLSLSIRHLIRPANISRLSCHRLSGLGVAFFSVETYLAFGLSCQRLSRRACGIIASGISGLHDHPVSPRTSKRDARSSQRSLKRYLESEVRAGLGVVLTVPTICQLSTLALSLPTSITSSI